MCSILHYEQHPVNPPAAPVPRPLLDGPTTHGSPTVNEAPSTATFGYNGLGWRVVTDDRGTVSYLACDDQNRRAVLSAAGNLPVGGIDVADRDSTPLLRIPNLRGFHGHPALLAAEQRPPLANEVPGLDTDRPSARGGDRLTSPGGNRWRLRHRETAEPRSRGISRRCRRGMCGRRRQGRGTHRPR